MVRSLQNSYIGSKIKRGVAFSKRKSGIFKKARMLETLTGSRIMIFISSESNKIFSYCSHDLKHLAENYKEILAGHMLKEREDYNL